MEVTKYLCDEMVADGKGTHKRCDGAGVYAVSSMVRDGNTLMKAVTKHSCGNNCHLGSIASDLLFDDEGNVAAANAKDAEKAKESVGKPASHNWQPVRQVDVWELHG